MCVFRSPVHNYYYCFVLLRVWHWNYEWMKKKNAKKKKCTMIAMLNADVAFRSNNAYKRSRKCILINVHFLFCVRCWAVDPAIQFININFYTFTRCWKSSADFSWINVSMNGSALFLNFFLHSFPLVAIGIFSRSNRCTVVISTGSHHMWKLCQICERWSKSHFFIVVVVECFLCLFGSSRTTGSCSDADSC